jgi:4-diphosphocytidyl-2-C-methyl-D-erythritol kinase
MQRLFKRPLEFERVPQILRELGSDVPFFALGGRAAGIGRGDEVYKLDDAVDYWVLLVDPGVMIPTAEAYSWLTVPDLSNSIESFGTESDHQCSGDVWTNDFEVPVFARYPDLAKIKEELMDLGAYRAALSGSGSTIYGQFQLVSEAVRAGSVLERRFRVKLTKPLPRWEYFQKIVEE